MQKKFHIKFRNIHSNDANCHFSDELFQHIMLVHKVIRSDTRIEWTRTESTMGLIRFLKLFCILTDFFPEFQNSISIEKH